MSERRACQLIGQHRSTQRYLPQPPELELRLVKRMNELAVRATDPPMDEKENRARFPEMLYNEIPHGKQDWYVQTGGLWQPVWLEVKPADYITGVKVVAKNEGLLLGDRPRNEDPEAEHIREDMRSELFGTTDVQNSIANALPWNPPDTPTPEGVSGDDATPNVMNDEH